VTMKIKNDLYNFHLIPAHTISRVWLDGDTLRIALLNYDWLHHMIRQKKLRIAHEEEKEDIVLTGTSHELQKFLQIHAEDREAFKHPIVFHR
jgi:hypothetical protein